MKIVSISLPDEVFRVLDEYCRTNYRKRSSVVTEALIKFLNVEEMNEGIEHKVSAKSFYKFEEPKKKVGGVAGLPPIDPSTFW